jgi:asparagine synthase (glutamine-hydrolysing)
MCGICGIVNFDHTEMANGGVVKRMTETLVHRGPDDDGLFVEGPAGLGFRRLSIIDLNGGHQPIFNEDGSAAIIFNGEIYNYRDLATGLAEKGHIFKTRSDTETILHAYEEYGDDCVQHLRGMFAFAIWERSRRRLLLARDRLGVKPLYYYCNGRFLAFASEIKALLEVPSVPREVDVEALDQYLALRYVPGPRTMFKNIFRLQPGHTLVLDNGEVHTKKYWDIVYLDPIPERPGRLEERFRELLEESVRLRLISEVPLGVFLSGGLDSSTILATMSKVAGGAIKTFSVGFEGTGKQEQEASEFEYARLAADTLGADHYEYRLTPRDFEEFVPGLVWHLDEPVADPSCIPLYFISKLAREHITVVLSGEGADEILGGYNIYRRMLAIESMKRSVPAAGTLAPWIERATPSESLRNYVRMLGKPLEATYRGVCRGLGIETRRNLIGESCVRRSEQQLMETFGEHFRKAGNTSALNRMLYVDTKVWLPDDLLVKADKMTMANGLELRVPFLDHKLVEFAATVPDSAKLGRDGGKSLLRRIVRGVVPDTIIDRPKKGFPVPISSWLRSPLRQFTRDHLLARNSACPRYLNRQAVSQLIVEHEQGRQDRSQELWTLLVFEFWHQHFIENHSQWRYCVA